MLVNNFEFSQKILFSIFPFMKDNVFPHIATSYYVLLYVFL